MIVYRERIWDTAAITIVVVVWPGASGAHSPTGTSLNTEFRLQSRLRHLDCRYSIGSPEPLHYLIANYCITFCVLLGFFAPSQARPKRQGGASKDHKVGARVCSS